MATKSEIQVIDDRMLIDGIFDERMIAENDVSRVNGEFSLVDLAPTVDSLSLSFKNIAIIENLVGFERLVKLCLDNNRIKEIKNLGHLVHLRWLDLSFNEIKHIQGLDSLTQLEDLTLYRNQITEIEGLEHCPKLQCLSLGNNHISSIEQVKKLRALRSLKMLTLAGNPIAREGEYRSLVLAYIDSITYLDYAMIDDADRALAKEQYHDELLDTEEKEMVLQEKFSRESHLADRLHELDQAGVLYAHTLFDELFLDDADYERLKHLPNAKDPFDAFKSAFKTLSDEHIRTSLEAFARRSKEITSFERAVQIMRTRDDTDSATLIAGYQRNKKSAADQITAIYSSITGNEVAKMIKGLFEELDRIADELLNIEMRQVERYEALSEEFESHLLEMKNETLEAQQLFFRAVEELEEKYSAGLRAAALDLIDRLARDELDQEYFDNDEAMSLVVDKDSCLQVLTSSHDLHVGRLQKKEDEARGSEVKRVTERLARYVTEEQSRNRDRVLQVHEFSRHAKSALHALLASDDDDGYEDEEHAGPATAGGPGNLSMTPGMMAVK